jgi:hypothetical protein
MSTKTLRKRIALVAVSAMGFGLISVAPSVAAHGADTATLIPAVLDNTVTTFSGRVGQQISINVTGSVAGVTATASDTAALSIAVAMTSQPGTVVYPTLTSVGALGTTLVENDVDLTYGTAANTTAQVSTGSSINVATVNYTQATKHTSN